MFVGLFVIVVVFMFGMCCVLVVGVVVFFGVESVLLLCM